MPAIIFSVVLILLIIYLYAGISGKTKRAKLSDEEILQIMENGFVDGVVGDTTTKDKELAAIKDVFDDASKGKVGSSRKTFYEGNINWKFVDTGATNMDCWTNWDYARKKADGTDEIIKENIVKTYKNDNGRVWCPVNEFTDANSRKEFDGPLSLMDKIEDNMDKVWGLAGAVGLGLTEEFIFWAIKKKAMWAAQNTAKKSAKEMLEDMFKKAGREIKQEFNERFVKKFMKKFGDESGEGFFKKVQQKIMIEFRQEIQEKLSKVLSKELSSKAFANFRKEVLEKYGKMTLSSLKDDFIKKAFKNIVQSLDKETLKRLTALAKNSAYAAMKEASKKASYMALTATMKAKVLSSALKQARDVMFSLVYRNMMKALKVVSTAIASLGSRLIWKIVSLKTKAVLALKTFFRTQAKSFLSIGKNLVKNMDDIAKMIKSLVLMSKSISRASIKAGFKTAMRSASKMLLKLKPGPLALFDMISFAMDMADVGGFNAYISTDDFEKEINKSNTEMKAAYVDAIKGMPFYKDMNISADNIDYPRVLDPTQDVTMDEIQDLISEKFNIIFRLASTGERHTMVKGFFESLEADLASGKLTADMMEDDTVMEKYIETIDLEDISNVVSNDLCNRVGGLIYDNNRCTYTKEQCDSLYNWPLDTEEKPERKNEIYAEFQNGRCVQANHMPRYLCDSAKAAWDKDTNSCIMDRKWCENMGAEYDLNTKKCNIPLTQKVVENIFGTSMTRLVKRATNPLVRPTQDLVNVFLNPPTTTEYVGTIKNSALNKCFTINTNTFPYKIELEDCGQGNNQQFYYNPATGLIVADVIKNKGRFLCLERPYGTGDKLYANYCDNSLSKDQTWDVNVVNGTIDHKQSGDSMYARGADVYIGQGATSNEKKFIIGVVKNANIEEFNKKVASNTMNLVTLGTVDWSPIIESGSTIFKVMTVVPEVARALASVFTQSCDILGIGNDVKKISAAASSTQTVQNTHYCGPVNIRDKCLDVKNKKLFNGAKPVIWDCNGGSNQSFAYHHVEKTIKPKLDNSYCLDVGGGNNGDEAKWWSCNGTQPQKFNYDPATKQISLDGNRNKCIDLNMDDNTNGTEFKVLDCKNHRAQQFTIKGCDNEEYINSIATAVGKTILDSINPLNWF